MLEQELGGHAEIKTKRLYFTVSFDRSSGQEYENESQRILRIK